MDSNPSLDPLGRFAASNPSHVLSQRRLTGDPEATKLAAGDTALLEQVEAPSHWQPKKSRNSSGAVKKVFAQQVGARLSSALLSGSAAL